MCIAQMEKRLTALKPYAHKHGFLPYTNLYPLKCNGMKKWEGVLGNFNIASADIDVYDANK